MPLARVSEMLTDAKKQKKCVAAFNCFNFESIKTVINAGEKLSAPVIVMLYPTMISHIPLTTFAEITKDLAKKSTQPVGLHLDHCDNYDFILEAVKAGFQSVIVDASRYEYSINADLTRRVVNAVKSFGADVEAELGFVGAGSAASDYTDSGKYTDPFEAKRFIEDTGIDYLAVAVGNAHGHYSVEPRLDIDCLKAINNQLKDIPLVLHGGSGIPDEQLKEAVKNGIAKTNFGTDFFNSFYNAHSEYILEENKLKNIFGLLTSGENGGLNYAENKILALI